MKKLILLSLISAFGLCAKAYDEAGVQPASITAGAVATLSINLNNTSMAEGSAAVQAFTLDIVWPDGWTIASPALVQERTATYDTDFEEYGESNFAIASQKNDGYTRYIGYSTNLTPLNGTSGAIFTVKVKAPADAVAGYYPIVIKAGSYLSNDNGYEENIVFTDMTSYVKVGDPSGVSLSMTGLIPSFVNEALASETAISTLDLTNVTASNGTFAYVPGRNVVAPASEVVADVKATVAPTSTYASVCLPFDATIDCYTMSEVKDGWASFVDATSLAKNTPALVNKEVTATASGVALAAVSADVKTSGYYMKGGEFCRVNGSVTIPALRGWWDIAAEVRGFVIAGEETAINSVENAEPQVVYNVAGVRLNKVQRGVNIVNGKKVVLK